MKSTPLGTQTARSAERRMASMLADLATRKTSRPLDSNERVLAQRLRKWADETQQEQIDGLLKTTGETNE